MHHSLANQPTSLKHFSKHSHPDKNYQGNVQSFSPDRGLSDMPFSSYPLKIYDIFTKLDEYFRTFSKLDCQKYPDVAIYAHPVLNPATTI